MVLHAYQRCTNNRIYVITRTTESTYYLRCQNLDFGCCATALVRQNNIDEIVETHPHAPSCLPSAEACEVIRFREAIRTAAKIHHEEPRALYDSFALIYPEAAVLVPFCDIQSAICRWRLSAFPDSPLSLEKLEYQINSPSNAGLFRHRQGTMSTRSLRDLDDCRHFAFFDLEFINHIAPNISTIMIDVTYKSCIEMEDENMQLGTVMAIYQNYSMPIMWFLMSRKTTVCYRKMASVIQELLQQAHIRVIVTDFESSLRNALQETFPNSYLTGCLFYYTRGLIGKIQDLNLDQYVKNNADANAFLRKIAALAFLHSEDIEAQLQEILDRTPQEVVDIFNSFIEYFQRFWMTKVKPVNFSVFGVHTRTNNALESYHSILLLGLGVHPPFWRWICKLKEILQNQWTDLSLLNQGLAVRGLLQYSTIFGKDELQMSWRQFLIGDTTVLELLTAASNLIQDYVNSNLNSMREMEIADLETRYNVSIQNNHEIDPELDQEVAQIVWENERLAHPSYCDEGTVFRHRQEILRLRREEIDQRRRIVTFINPLQDTAVNSVDVTAFSKALACSPGRLDDLNSYLAPLDPANTQIETKNYSAPALAKDQPAAGSCQRKILEAFEAAAVAFPTYESQLSAAQGFFGDNKAAGPSFAGETNRSYNGGICNVCREKEKTQCFLPCGHFCSCLGCARKISTSTKLCPICRQLTSTYFQILY